MSALENHLTTTQAIADVTSSNASPNAVEAPAETLKIPLEVAPEAHINATDAPNWEDLAARFRPIFARIAVGAIEREQKRELAFEAVAWLREARFGAVRIPKAYGGLGATIPQLFRLMLELAEADSNLSHLFRGHFSFLEQRLNTPNTETHAKWFPKIAEGAILGYAMAERHDLAGNAKLIRENGEIFLDGLKYYSTGTIYADWIIVSMSDGEGGVSVAVPVDAPGVTRIDDWDGFGQRLTGSGTTKFARVKVTEEQILRYNRREKEDAAATAAAAITEDPAAALIASKTDTHGWGMRTSYQKSFLQLVLLASITGAGKAALREGITFVLPRTRTFNTQAGHGRALPKDDPLVQRVIGKVSSLVYSAETHVIALSQHLEELYQLAQRGKATEADYVSTEIKAFQAQQIVLPTVLEATTLVFEVGGASATSESRRMDRHWRNARTAASHNPAIQRERAIGDFLINGVSPDQAARDVQEKVSAEKAAEAARQASATNASVESSPANHPAPTSSPTTAVETGTEPVATSSQKIANSALAETAA